MAKSVVIFGMSGVNGGEKPFRRDFSHSIHPLDFFLLFWRRYCSTSYYYPNQTYCDNDPSDTDYIFVYYFPSVISDPDSLRLISSDFLVDSMLAYYQWHYGGLKGFGLYNTSKVSICVGDNGIQYGGGADHISAYMKMHRDYQGVPASPMQHQ